MKHIEANCTFEGCEYKTTSYYGNPSYWMWFKDADGNYHSGYTGSNCACGYSVRNFKSGDKVLVKYHYTQTGACIVTGLREVK